MNTGLQIINILHM